VDTPPRAGGVWNTLNTRYLRTDIQNHRTREAVLGAAYKWGVESTPSQISLSMHSERQEIEGSNIEHNDAVYFGYRKTFQLTDNPLLPRRGLLGTVHAGTSVPGLATQPFLRFTAKGHLLVPVGREADFALRAEGGVVVASSRSGIPSSFLFRTGGDQTLRGYALESIGVRQGIAIVGGRYLALASAEYTWWFSGDWGAAAFVDAGDAFDSRSAFDVAVGYGLGARWRSPIGPLRADLAYGRRTGKVRLHFSAGFSF
jgi:translocation and assembly module TamA